MKQLFLNYGIDISDEEIEKFNSFYRLLIEWNKKMNLTAITDYTEVIKKHFLDSCLIFRKFNRNMFYGKMIIDVGTGAGFPGIPLAIMLPDTKFVLMDSLNKRIEFLDKVVSELELSNVSLIHSRAEKLGKNEIYRENFDYCISRAVAGLPILLEYCSPFIKVDGKLLLYKSIRVDDEINDAQNALDLLNCIVEDDYILVQEEEYSRNLLIISKTELTPIKYPRKPGKVKKSPL